VPAVAGNDFLKDPSACTLTAGELQAVFLPGRGMLCASLRHRGIELLRRVRDLEAAAARGRTAGIPLLHPWANRLSGPRYRAAGQEVVLDLTSPLLHLDEHGLPMHGVPWSLLAWEVTEARPDCVTAYLDWARDGLLTIFPFRHRLQMTAILNPDGLRLDTTLSAGSQGPVPVSFGFHPYLGVAELPRAEWQLSLPAMRHLRLDSSGIPNSDTEQFDQPQAKLGTREFDDGFALLDERTSFSLTGRSMRICVDFLAGYRYAQVFAPKGEDFVAIEPMTAPTGALSHGRGLQVVPPGSHFHTAFCVRVDA
jgi:aldose 1-epimerase